jgi:hypothetical protein
MQNGLAFMQNRVATIDFTRALALALLGNANENSLAAGNP